MKFLGNHGNSQLGESLNAGINEVHRTPFCRSEIHFNGLPGAGPMLDSNFDTNGVGLFHIPSSRFDSKLNEDDRAISSGSCCTGATRAMPGSTGSSTECNTEPGENRVKSQNH
jgi:hypothetical protein